jgi:hypothetical protein
MDIVTILRNLSRHRVLVSGALVLALLAGVGVTHQLPSFKSRQYQVGVASERLLVDTPSSQVVNVAPRGVDTVGVTANLLATLMIDGPLKSAIAARAGLPPGKIVGTTSAATLTQAATSAPSRGDFSLSTQVVTDPAGNALPIVEVDVQAPTGAGAAKLVNAVIAGVQDFMNSTAAKEQIPDADRIQVDSVAASPAATETRGPSNLIGLAVVVGVFLLGCAAILGGRALVGGWRAAAARERVGEDGGVEADETVIPDRIALHPDRPVSVDFGEGAGETSLATSQGPSAPLPKAYTRRSARSYLQPLDTIRPHSRHVAPQSPADSTNEPNAGIRAQPGRPETTSDGARIGGRGAFAFELAAHRGVDSPHGHDAQDAPAGNRSAQSDHEADADAAAAAAGD